MIKKLVCGFIIFIFTINLGMLNISDPSEAGFAPPPPLPSGNEIQYIVGDWDVDSSVYFEDKIIDLRGNLSIYSGARLSFKNVTLRMNVTADNQNYKIWIQNGGYFEMYDRDDNPATTDDKSVITDSPVDIDFKFGKDPDFRYYFQNYGGLFVKNSLIEEVGVPNYYLDYSSLWVKGDLYMENSTFRQSNSGIYCYSTDDVLIKYCTIEESDNDGLLIQTCTNPRILHNTIKNITLEGIEMSYGSGARILGNVIRNAGREGIDVYKTENVRIENNTIINTQRGIYLRPYRQIYYIRNNIIDKATDQGIYTYRLIDSVIYGNEINNTKYGLWTTSTERSIIEYNKIFNITSNGIRSIQDKDTIFRMNTINSFGSYGFYCEGYSNVKNVIFENNTVMNTAYGFQISSAWDVTVKYNKLIGRNTGYGIRCYKAKYLRFEHNDISKYTYGMDIKESSFDFNDHIEIYGGSFKNIIGNELLVYATSYVYLYNVSINLNKIVVNEIKSYVNVYYNVDVYVNDTEGAVGGARVTASDTSGKGLEPVTKPTDQTGWARGILVLNQTKFKNGVLYYGPYNFSSNVSNSIAYGDQNYSIDSYTTLNIYHDLDTFPTPPVDLRIEVEYSSIILTWECYVTDLDSYKIYRNDSSGGWEMIEKVKPPPPGVTKSWEDKGMANKLVEFKYKVHHNDTSGQEEQNDDWVIFTDWVITDFKRISDQNKVINGSLIIENGGDLYLINTSINMNGTHYSPGIKTIEVREGGRLLISDHDDNKSTTNDRSFINASKAAGYFNFIVEPGGNLEIYNSWIQNATLKDPFGDINILILSDNCTIKGNTIISSNRAIYLEDAENCVIDGNIFYNETIEFRTAIDIFRSDRITVSNNTILRPFWNGINIDESKNIEIKDNNFTLKNYKDSEIKGIELYTSNDILVENNIIYNSSRAIYVSANEDIVIESNTIFNCTIKGVEIEDSKTISIKNNTLDMNDGVETIYGIYLYNDEYIDVINNTIYGFKNGEPKTYGMYIFSFYELNVLFNNIKGPKTGIRLGGSTSISSGTVLIGGNIIHDAVLSDGVGVELSYISDVWLANNTMYNVHTGFLQKDSPNILYVGNVHIFVDYCYSIKYSSSASIINATILDLPPYAVYLNESSEADILNPNFNQTRITVSDQTCEARIYWTINVRIKDHYGNYIPNIFLQVRSLFGTILYEGYTDTEGYIKNLIIMERSQLYNDNIMHTPTNFNAEYANHTTDDYIAITKIQTVELQLGNTPPNVYNIMLLPQTPRTKDDLILQTEYTFLDAENDAESGTYYKWYKYVGENLIYVPELDNFTTVPSSYTTKGEVWFCRVVPGDGLDYGIYGHSLMVLIFNTKPEVMKPWLYPDNPDGLTELNVEYEYFDIDDDEELGTTFYWFASTDTTFELRATTSKPVLDPVNTNKGEHWYVEVEPKDGEDAGDRYQSNIITIGNTKPSLDNVFALPSKASSSDNISVSYEFIDIDGDLEGNTTFKWLKDTGLKDKDGNSIGFLESGFNTQEVSSEYLTKGEKWMCQVTPHDGIEAGQTVNSSNITIGNTPPVTTNLQIQPTEPETFHDLYVTYDYSDRDVDPENETQFEWLKMVNGDFIKTGLKIKTLPSLYTQKGDVWVCDVTPFDGFGFGETIRSPSISIGNSAPIVQQLKISPGAPKTQNDLNASYKYKDDNGDGEGNTLIKWYKNGIHAADFDGQSSIPPEATIKGEVWHFTVTPHDGFMYGPTFTSPSITIVNTPPVIISPTITPGSPYSDDDLAANYEIFDADGDDIESTQITWYMNGEEQQPHHDDPSRVSANATEKGQSWKYTIIANDGEQPSTLYESSSVTIKNLAPELKCYPQESVLYIEETESITFSIDADDRDGDLLIIQWFQNRKNKGGDYNYLFTTDYTSAGNYTINITVQDSGTGSIMVSNEWQVFVADNNRAPSLSINEPLVPNPVITEEETLKFDVTYSDPDVDDSPLITWYLDNKLILEDEKTYIYKPESVGDHVVSVKVTDGEVNKTYSWNVTVQGVTKITEGMMGLSWDQWSIVLEALVIGVTGLAAFIGFLKLRKRKGALQRYMKEIEAIMKKWKDDPDAAEEKLVALAETIETDFSEGRIEDFHFILLDRQVKESLRDIRQSKLKRGFGTLPDNLKREINIMLEDGQISDKEYRTFITVMSQSDGITPEDKAELRKLMRSWKETGVPAGVKKPPAKSKSLFGKKKKKYEASQLAWEDIDEEPVEEEPSEPDLDLDLSALDIENEIEEWPEERPKDPEEEV
ncbi:MAG: right-handed parallel beta-helix repeat-containing protein [Thermoplasmata archaeon]|nr:MAG: right-handed parallel beta-helix repeat-containing protein [Thermoplasmata archaeon]